MKNYTSLFFIMVSVVAMSFAVAFPKPVHAEDRPEVYVKDIVIAQKTYSVGDTVTGTFTLWNAKAQNVPDVYYKISLAGEYAANGLPGVIYDTKTFGPVFLSANQQKKVPFSYTIPAGAPTGSFGIQVRSYLKSGGTLGWSDAGINLVAGTNPKKGYMLAIKNASIVIGKNTFDIGVGPTLYKEDNGTLNLTLENKTDQTLSLNPQIAIYARSTIGSPLLTKTEQTVSIKTGTTTVSFELPLFNHKAGVYAGRVKFTDTAGIEQTLPFEFRYIVAGDIVTIHSFTTDKQFVAQNESIVATVHYSGSPYDITNGVVSGDGNADLTIRLYNEKNEIVGDHTEKVDFNQGDTKQISIVALKNASEMRGDVIVQKAGSILASYSTSLTSKDLPPAKTVSVWYIILGLFGLIVAAFITIKYGSKKGASLATTGLVIFLAVFGLFGFTHEAHAWTETGRQNITCVSYNGPGNINGAYCWPSTVNFIPDVTINTPSGTLLPGQQFYFMGSLEANACLNKPQDVKFSITWQGVTNIYTQRINPHGGEGIVSNNYDFSYGPYYAPNADGTYKVDARFDNYVNIPRNGENGLRGWVAGYQQFQVVTPPPTTGDVQIVSVNADGTPHTSHVPRYLERNYGSGVALYLKDSHSVPPASAWFRDMNPGGNYTSSYDTNYGAVSVPTYTEVALAGFPIKNIVQKSLQNFFALFDQFTPKKIFAATGVPCDRDRPEDLPQAGDCKYNKGSPECYPSNFIDLDVRPSAAGSQNCLVDFYYKQSGFSVTAGQVSKVVFLWGGENNGPFDYSLSNDGPMVLTPSTSGTNTIGVTKAQSATENENVSLSATVSGPGITATFQNNNGTCTPSPTCNPSPVLVLSASNSVTPGVYQVIVTGVSGITHVTHTTTFQVTIPEGDPNLTVTCRPTAVNPVTGQVLDPTSQAGIGQVVTWKSNVNPAGSGYTYTWTGTNGLSASGAGLSEVQKTYYTIGKKIANLFVRAPNGDYGSAVCGTGVTVKLNPDWGQF